MGRVIQSIEGFVGKSCKTPFHINEFGDIQVFNVHKKLENKSEWMPGEWPPKKVKLILREVE